MKKNILLGLLAVSIPFFTFTSCEDDDEELNPTNKNAEIAGQVYSLGNCVLTLRDNNICEFDSIKNINSKTGEIFSDTVIGTYYYSGSDFVLKTTYLNVDDTTKKYEENMTMFSKVTASGNGFIIAPYYKLSVASTETSVILSCDGAELSLNGMSNLNADAQGFYTMDFTASSFWNHDMATSVVETTEHKYKYESVGAYAYQVDQSTGNAQLILNDNNQTYYFTIGQVSNSYYLYGQPVEMTRIR